MIKKIQRKKETKMVKKEWSWINEKEQIKKKDKRMMKQINKNH